MSIATEYSRLVFKRSALSGIVPTIPTATTIDNTWVSTDLLVGEAFVNLADDRFWFRTDNGIVEVALSGNSMYRYTTGATLVGNTIFFDRTDLLSAYTVDLSSIVSSGGTISGNYLPLTVTGTTFVNVDNNILYFTGNSATTIINAVVGGDSNSLTQATSISQTGAVLSSQNTSTLDSFYVSSNQANGASLEYNTGTTVNIFKVNKSTIRASSTIPTFPGITYDIDYSANYTNRSLVDKEYVDGLAFSGSSASTQSLSDTLVIGNTTGPNDIIIDAGQLIKDATSNSTIELGDGFATLYSTGINAVSSNLQEDLILLDPTLSNNGSGIQSFDTATGGQGQFYVTPQSVILNINDGISDSVSITMLPTSITIESDNIKLPSVPSGTFTASLGLDSTGKIVTGATSGGGSFLPLTGGTLTGPLVVNSSLKVTGNTIVNELSATTLTLLNSGATTRNYSDYSSNLIRTGVTNSTIAAGSGNTINANLNNVFVAGANLTATTSNYAYFSNVNVTSALQSSTATISGTLSAATIFAGGVNTNACDLSFAISDEVTAITSGTSKLTLYAPYGLTITKVIATLSTSGSSLSEFDINLNGSTIFTRRPTIDANEFHSDDATAGQPILSTTTVSYKDKITVDIDQAGIGAKGAKIYILGTRTS